MFFFPFKLELQFGILLQNLALKRFFLNSLNRKTAHVLAFVPAFNLRVYNKDLELSINEGDYLLKFGCMVLVPRQSLQMALT